MAKKVLKTRTQFTSTLRNPIYKGLQIMSQETHVPMSKLLDQCVGEMIRKYEMQDPVHVTAPSSPYRMFTRTPNK